MSGSQPLPGPVPARPPALVADKVTIAGGEATAFSPEGQTATMALPALLEKVAPPCMSTGDVVLPDGVKWILSRGPVTIWIHESPPRPYHFLWIDPNSPAPYGRGTKYRSVHIALPYLIICAVFMRSGRGQLELTSRNECFFRVAPLKSADDELLYPALLNCSKFRNPAGHPLSWICTQYLGASQTRRGGADQNARMRSSFEALRHCLLETAFNYSSEHHEGSSWFSESRQVDPRIHTIEAWEKATAQDNLFVMEVPWLKTGLSVRQMAERIFNNHTGVNPGVSAATLARIIFNQAPGSAPRTCP